MGSISHRHGSSHAPARKDAHENAHPPETDERPAIWVQEVQAFVSTIEGVYSTSEDRQSPSHVSLSALPSPLRDYSRLPDVLRSKLRH